MRRIDSQHSPGIATKRVQGRDGATTDRELPQLTGILFREEYASAVDDQIGQEGPARFIGIAPLDRGTIIQFLVSDYQDIGMLATGLMIATLPVLVLYLFLSEWFVKGYEARRHQGVSAASTEMLPDRGPAGLLTVAWPLG